MASEAVVVAAETEEGRAEAVVAETVAVGVDTVVGVGRETAVEVVATAEAVEGSAVVATEAGHRIGRRHWAPAQGRSRARLQARSHERAPGCRGRLHFSEGNV